MSENREQKSEDKKIKFGGLGSILEVICNLSSDIRPLTSVPKALRRTPSVFCAVFYG
jgi:hypothetical protein